MARTRDILGHVDVEVAQRARKCHHKKEHKIASGEPCLVVKGQLPNERKNYCLECGGAILEAATARLRELVSEFRTG